MAVAENGIFEVSRNKYSKCYRFQDINYTKTMIQPLLVQQEKNELLQSLVRSMENLQPRSFSAGTFRMEKL